MTTTQQTADQFAGQHENVTQPAPHVQHQGNTMNSIRDPRRKSSFLASLLSFLPGLGQVYVGYYRRGFINILTFGTLVTILAGTPEDFVLTPLVALFMVFFVFYNIVDAGRRATLFNLSLEGIEQIDLPDELTNNPFTINGSYLLGTVLLLVGLISLSHTLFDYSLEWLNEWWPIAPIGFGAYLVYMAYRDGRKEGVGDNDAD